MFVFETRARTSNKLLLWIIQSDSSVSTQLVKLIWISFLLCKANVHFIRLIKNSFIWIMSIRTVCTCVQHSQKSFAIIMFLFSKRLQTQGYADPYEYQTNCLLQTLTSYSDLTYSVLILREYFECMQPTQFLYCGFSPKFYFYFAFKNPHLFFIHFK